MTQHVRKSYHNHRKATWAAVVVVLVAATLALVLPALAINTTGCDPANSTDCVKPESTLQKIVPSIVQVGGSNFSCASAGSTAGMRQFQISKPTPGTYRDPDTGVEFVVTAPGTGKDPKSFFSFVVQGNRAIVLHVGVNGGTNTAWYDYVNNAPRAGIPGGGVLSDTDLHSTPDSKYTPSKPSFFVASHTTFCYVPLTTGTGLVQPDCDSPFQGFGFGGTGGTVVYEAQLVPINGDCKLDQLVMFWSTRSTPGSPDGDQELFATLNPVNENAAPYEVVEHLRWTGISGDSQNPIKLRYDDIPPYDGVDTAIAGNDGWREMKLCGSDPRPDKNDFELGGSTPAMPADTPAHTTCMLQSTDSAGTGPNLRVYDAWLFSTVDGARGGT